MVNLVAGLIEALEQANKLSVARNPATRLAIRIPANAISGTIMGGTQYVVPVATLIEILKEQLPDTV